MRKRDQIKRVFKGKFSKKPSESESTSTAIATASEPRLIEPTDEGYEASLTPNRSQRAPVRDLWRLAFEKLSDENKDALSQIQSDSKLEILRRLRTAVVEKQTECESKRWKFELKGRQIILRDVAEKIIVWIDKFKQIGDIVVNFDPVHASLPWAGFRLFLEMTVAESQQMGALLTGVEKITPLIGRCQIYEALYLEGEHSEQEESKLTVTNLISALGTLYATMLRFIASAIRSYNQGIVNRTLCAILNPAEVIGFLDQCQTLENNVAIEVDNCERLHTRRIQAISKKQIQDLRDILADLQTPILRIDSRVAALCENLDTSERLRIFDWISAIRYEENHFFACQGRTSGTGKWLLRHERFREWRTSSASMILWLHGDPGAGKTKLVSTVVDDLLTTFKHLPNDEAFAYFYCDRNQPDRQEPALILSSFVRQLSTSRNAIPRSTVQMYKQKQQTGFASGKLKMEESQTVLADLFQVYPQITLVVDALDECDKKTRLGFLAILDTLIAESSKPVKILISSRLDRDIKHYLENGPNLGIRAIDNRNDIEMFVNHEVAASEKFWRDKIGFELKNLICNTLVERSEGMFQWVALQIAALRELGRERDIRNRLGKLPETLKAAYDEIYHKIQSQKESTPMIANRAFQWVMCSCWPLSPAELVAAVCQDPDTDEIDEIDVNIDFVLAACQNLLVIDHEADVCRYSHLSVQEYFETHHWSSCEANSLVGKVCLSLLISNSATPKLDEPPLAIDYNSKHDIFKYSCCNWPTHVQRLEEKGIVENRFTALLDRFLGSVDQSSLAYKNWYKMAGKYLNRPDSTSYDFSLRQSHKQLIPCSRPFLAMVTFGFYKTILDWWTVDFIPDINLKNSSGNSLLVLGAMSGSLVITEDLLRKGADVNTAGKDYCSALQAASSNGFESIVRLLLDKGAEVNAQGKYYSSALQVASSNGSESIVRLLLDKGADVNASGGFVGSALQAASYKGSESIVRLLLDEGADINASDEWYGSALQAASFNGSESIVRLLLDKGADVNASGGHYGSALQAASYKGSESIVRLLLNKGADFNASGGGYGSALQVASFNGFEPIVWLLLDKGADINASGGFLGSALQAASSKGSKSIMRLLLDKGAEVDASGGHYGSALQAASNKGFKSIVQMLLDRGADVNASGGHYGSALQAASFCGSKSVVQLLLNKGTDINALGGKYGSSLQAASFSGHESVVELLLDKGVDVNASGGVDGSALWTASFRGHKLVVELLLDKGADVNASSAEYGGALQAASFSGHKSVVMLLLDKGADINVFGGNYGSALQAASLSGHESVVQLLLDRGADLNALGGDYGSALQAASCSGHESVVEVLLEKGADINALGGEYGSALQAASFSGHESVVQLLLDRGADLNALGGDYGSALQAASFSGHESVVQLLLDRGADLNTLGGDYGSALQAASCSGHESVVQLLLDRGAEINTSGGKYGSALQAASFDCSKSIVKMLLDRGADVHASGGEYGSALQAASFSGDESVVQLLLDRGADVNQSGGEYGSALGAASSNGRDEIVQLLQAAMERQ